MIDSFLLPIPVGIADIRDIEGFEDVDAFDRFRFCGEVLSDEGAGAVFCDDVNRIHGIPPFMDILPYPLFP